MKKILNSIRGFFVSLFIRLGIALYQVEFLYLKLVGSNNSQTQQEYIKNKFLNSLRKGEYNHIYTTRYYEILKRAEAIKTNKVDLNILSKKHENTLVIQDDIATKIDFINKKTEKLALKTKKKLEYLESLPINSLSKFTFFEKNKFYTIPEVKLIVSGLYITKIVEDDIEFTLVLNKLDEKEKNTKKLKKSLKSLTKIWLIDKFGDSVIIKNVYYQSSRSNQFKYVAKIERDSNDS